MYVYIYNIYIYIYIKIFPIDKRYFLYIIYIYTSFIHHKYHISYHIYRCPRRNVPNFGRVFLMLKYTDITQNTYIQS